MHYQPSQIFIYFSLLPKVHLKFVPYIPAITILLFALSHILPFMLCLCLVSDLWFLVFYNFKLNAFKCFHLFLLVNMAQNYEISLHLQIIIYHPLHYFFYTIIFPKPCFTGAEMVL